MTRYTLQAVSKMLNEDPYIVAALTEAGLLPGPGAATSTRRPRDDDGLYSEADLGFIRRHAARGLSDPKASGLLRTSNRAMAPPGVDQRTLRLRLRTGGKDEE